MAPKTEKLADVILAASETSMDLFYTTGFPAPDPFPWFRIGRRRYLIASDLEIGRAKKTARVDTVLPLTRYQNRLKKAGKKSPDLTDVLIAALEEKKVKKARVPSDFPVLTADRMRRAGIKVEPVDGAFFPERLTKSEAEIDAIREAARLTGEAIELGIDTLRRSKPRSGKLYLDGAALTSESVRAIVDSALMERELLGRNTIVAGGEHAVDPHDRGSGPLRSGWPVIFDVFPKSAKTGYHADISRTVLRGRPKKRHLEMWEAVKEGQALGVSMVRPGVNGREIHEAIQKVFTDRGFKTGKADGGGMQGFYHGTGHGLGLDVHEPPRVAAYDQDLEAGMVITIEPGLYYPGLGGIRIEDDVAVTKDGVENLVAIEKYFVI